MLQPLECEILLSPEELRIYLESGETTCRIVMMQKDRAPISIEPQHDKIEIMSWVKDVWEDPGIFILVP